MMNNKNIAIITVISVVLLGVGILFLTNSASSSTTSNTQEAKTSSQSSAEGSTADANLRLVDVKQFATEILKKDAVILDIRTPEEYALGRINGAINIDYYASDFADELDQLDKDASYKIYCNSGNRSASALQIMQQLGFTDVVELDGGIVAWNLNNLPTCTNC